MEYLAVDLHALSGEPCETCGQKQITNQGFCHSCWALGVWDRLGVPKRYRGYSPEAWRGRLPSGLRRWIDDPTVILVIMGEMNKGKTHAATAALVHVARRRSVSGVWVDAASLGDQLRRDEFEDQVLYRRIMDSSVALIDDYGHQGRSEYIEERLETILRTRYNDCLGTLIVTNLAQEQVAEGNPTLRRRLFQSDPVQF